MWRVNGVRRVLAAALEGAAEVVSVCGAELGDTLIQLAVELMPPKPPRKSRKAEQQAKAEQQEAPWWQRAGF